MRIINLKLRNSNLQFKRGLALGRKPTGETRGRSTAEGFTMLELLMSVALITIIAGFGIPVYQSFQVKNDLDVATNTVAQMLHRAQSLAQSGDGDSSWGVEIEDGSITLFKGVTFAGRDSDYDEVYNVPASITSSGLDEVIFEKFTGLPQSTGAITLETTTNETRELIINSKGTLTY